MFRIGILIAGSLYWSESEHRRRWRNERLRLGSEICVNVPIRYGRLSSTGTYTMVFAPGSPMGEAKVVECLAPAETSDDAIREAQALWLAESLNGSPRRATETLASDWGCVAMLANPKSALPANLIDEWAVRVAKEYHHRTKALSYDSCEYTVKGASAITNRGILQIEWPVQCDTHEPVSSIDLLLATATKPTPVSGTKDYPTADEVAEKWKEKNDDSYFRGNRNHGFHTFQDKEIEGYL